jgi:hypothetical protein
LSIFFASDSSSDFKIDDSVNLSLIRPSRFTNFDGIVAVRGDNTHSKNFENVMGTEECNCQKRGKIERYKEMEKREDVGDIIKKYIRKMLE